MKLARRFRATSSLFVFGARRGIKKSLSLWFVRDKASLIIKHFSSIVANRRFACLRCFLRRGLSRKAPSNARGDDPFLGGFFFSFFRPPRWGRSRNLASHRPSQAFSFLRGPAFLLCGNLLSLDRGNDCALPFIFPGWFVPSGSRSDRAGPGLGRGSGDGYPATLSEGGIQPQHISKPG